MHTNKGRFRSLATLGIIAIGVAGCSAKPEFPAEAFQQVSAATDRALEIVQSTSATPSPNDVRIDVKTQSDAVLSALRAIESHRDSLEIKDRFDAFAAADVLACLSARIPLDVEVLQAKLDAALRSGDEMRVIGWQQMLTDLSRQAVQCAMLATATLSTLQSDEAFDLVGALIGPVYANAMTWQALDGLALDSLLERHVAANALIRDRLAPRCAQRSDSAQRVVTTSPCISYQLAMQSTPKLQAALPTRTPLPANAVTSLTRITDSQLRLLDVGSKDLSTARQSVERVAGAVKAAQGEIQRQGMAVRIGNRTDARVYIQMKACSDSHALLFENVTTFIRRFDELQVPDETAAKARRSAFGALASDASHCAIKISTYLRAVADLGAVDKLGMIVGEIYATAFATQLLAGAHSESLLAPQLEAYQTVVNRLASRCDPERRSVLTALFGKRNVDCASYQAAADALSKLAGRKGSVRNSSPQG